MKLGFIGLGKMGNRMVTKLIGEDHDVIVWNRTSEKAEELKVELGKLQIADSVKELVDSLEKPRVIWSMVPAGDATAQILDEVAKNVQSGDILIDGGNSKYTDTQTRYDAFKKNGIKFLGIGVSGGIIAATDGYPMMVGGERDAYDYIKPLLDSLAKPNGGHEYFGEGGAGHFVKMVHNGIEYGIMQSIGEGFGVLEKSPYNLDLVKVAKLYQKGTLVSGFMTERTIESLENDPKLEKLEGEIDASGEGLWTVDEGKKLGVPVEIIEDSLNFRTRSKIDPKVSTSFAARMVAALRNAFGGHEVKKKSS